MPDASTILSCIITLIIAIATSVIGWKQVARKSRDDLEAVKQEQRLSVEREARLFEYKKKYEQFQTVSTDFMQMRHKVYLLWPKGLSWGPAPGLQPAHDQEICSDAVEAYNLAYAALTAMAPFISVELYKEGIGITTKCSLQIEYFADIYIRGQQIPSNQHGCWLRTDEIDEAIEKWHVHIREELDAGKIELTHSNSSNVAR